MRVVSSSRKRVGVFGGSFNPIHCGHIALAEKLLTAASLDQLWLMLSPHNPLKQRSDLLADELRLRLARAAVRGVSGVSVSDYEMLLPRPSYTWNTLEHLRVDFPSLCPVLVIGADNWLLFPRWYRAADIVKSYEIVIYPRRGYEVDTLSLPHGVRLVDTPLYDISSTEVRRRVSNGESIDGLVPPQIAQEVIKLYKDTLTI